MQVQQHTTEQFLHKSQLSSKDSKSSKGKSQTPPKIQYRGMTLKEYFKICDQKMVHHQIDELQGQSRCSSSQQVTQTPTFGLNDNNLLMNRHKNKLKTEIDDIDQSQNIKKACIKKKDQHFCPIITHKFSQPMELKLQQHPATILQKQNQRKRMISVPSKFNSKQLFNRSTLASFYNLNKKNKKMLNKLKSEKNKINDLRLSDAFCITKYASKFISNDKSLTNP